MLSTLACSLNFWSTATQEPVVPVTTEAVESLEETAQSAFQEAQNSGELSLVINEAQLTSIFAFELEEQAGEIINNLQLLLRDGQIQMTGDLNNEDFSASVKAIVEVSVDPVGRPSLNVISANLGPFPAPGDMVSEVEMVMNKAFQEQIKSMAPEMHVEEVIIDSGKMTITGRKK